MKSVCIHSFIMKKRLSNLQYWLLSILVMSLSACSENSDNLEAFIRDAGKNMQAKIKPLPEMKSYFSFEFNADGALTDPFKTHATFNQNSTFSPNLDRPKQPLEAYPLESLQYVGMIEQDKRSYALLRTPDNNVQKISIGQYMGQNFGKVTEIKENEVTLQEVVQDASTGNWVAQTATIALQE